jgi:NADP-dependent 3-hydroxy acid dehydrogenase YdfG
MTCPDPAVPRGLAVVTGGSSGIGAACVAKLAAAGFDVVAGARRLDRLARVCAPVGARALPLDVTDDGSVAEFCAAVGGPCSLLVNNAGGALGLDPVERADLDGWRTMYDANVLGTVRVTKALLSALEAADGGGTVVVIGSIAGIEPYEGGAGYNAAKHAAGAVRAVLRYELLGRPVRVCEVDPGMVDTEFSLVRFGGDAERAAAVYQGTTPLTADDVADCVAWVATRPPHVNVDRLVVQPRDQASARRVHRA